MRISNHFLFFLCVSIFFIKIVFYYLFSQGFFSTTFGGGSDADYYNDYAKGFYDNAVNVWPILLRFLNDFNFYSRSYVSLFLFFLNLVIIPLLVIKLCDLKFKNNQKEFLILYLLILLYPTLYFYSLDVFRDVFMVFVFLLGIYFVKKSINKSSLSILNLYFVLACLMGVLMMNLRPYLGYAFFLSFLFINFRFTTQRIFLILLLYFSILFIMNYLGMLSTLTDYRSGFEDISGGSTLGLDFSNPISFIPNLILSILGQFFGLYFTNSLAVVLFFIETLPVALMLFYAVKNINYSDMFVRFLIVFFVLYGSVWLIGNDNLGTAVRLRIYNYLVIYICFFYILRTKYLSSKSF
ncbi:hypothetical protein [Acinetobacter indicus]|uniref:hypothetical protein n=1 Tax=Acinetobacter indicus TaxID=756892 RepID=UPI0020971338|nr:hypothetical protein [Acinetobacter indicus]MCO8109088.1 hypothetical protein [Acinetobacter indicus]